MEPSWSPYGALWSLTTGLIISRFDGLIGSPGKSQKEGQEDQGTLKQLGGPPLALLSLLDCTRSLNRRKTTLALQQAIQKRSKGTLLKNQVSF